MNKKEIISKVLSESSADTVKTAEELEALLDKELSKPDTDYGLVNELTLSVLEAKGKKPLENDVDEKLTELKEMQSREKKRYRLPKWAVGLAVACVMIMCANAFSVSAWNMNIFTLIVEFTKGGVKIDFGSQKEEIILPTSEDDPYGIIVKCSEVGIDVETPHYLPDNFLLTTLEVDDTEEYKYLFFRFENNDSSISITIDDFMTDTPTGIPSDKHNLQEIDICGHTAIVSTEDNQMVILFRSGDYMVNIFTQDIDYSECEKIIKSIK